MKNTNEIISTSCSYTGGACISGNAVCAKSSFQLKSLVTKMLLSTMLCMLVMCNVLAQTQTVYELTNTITSGKKYLVVSSNIVGDAYALGHSSTAVSKDAVSIIAGSIVYINNSDVDATSVWTATASSTSWTFKNGDYYIRCGNNGGLSINTTDSNRKWTYNGTNNTLYNDSKGKYLRYSGSSWSCGNDGNVYIFEEKVKPTYTITWSINGVQSSDTYAEGHHITDAEIPTPTSSDCDDSKVFVGWTTSPIATSQNSAPTPFYSSSTLPAVTGNATYYAVFVTDASTWNLVSDVSSLSVGNKVVIAASGYYYAISTTQNSNNRGRAAITKSGSTITWESNAGVCEFELRSGSETGSWAFYDSEKRGYIYAASSNNNYLKTQQTNNVNSSWFITISNGETTVIAENSINRNNLRYNSDGWFSCYQPGKQKPVVIYKKIENYSGYITECCSKPKNLAVSDITDTEARISWNAGLSESLWELKYGESGFDVASGGSLVENINQAAYTIENLTSSTQYDVYVRRNCGSGDYSAWVKVSFTTPTCDPADMCEISYALTCTDGYYAWYNEAAIRVVDDETDDVLAIWKTESESYFVAGTLPVCDGRRIRFEWVSGNYDNVCAYEVKDELGNIIFSGEGALSSTFYYTMHCPTCHMPAGLEVSDVVSNAGTINWTGSSGSYDVRYRETVFFDDFETELDGWTIYTQGESPETNGWYAYDPSIGLSFNAHNGSYVASAWSWAGDAYDADNWLITPQLELQGVLKFWVITSAPYPDEYEVRLSISGNAIGDFTIPLQAMAAAPGFWTEVSIDLSAYEGQTGYIALHHEYYDGNYLLIDDFGVYGAEWTSTTTTDAHLNLTGLEPETGYDVQVRVNCGNDDYSLWGSTMFATPCEVSSPTLTTSDVHLCLGTTITLTAGGGTQYKWQGDADFSATNTKQVTLLSDAAYTVTVKDANECISSKSLPVEVAMPDIEGDCQYIWRGGTEGYLTDWNIPTNWYHNSLGEYLVASGTPTTSDNIYIGTLNGCANNATPTLSDAAGAKNITIESGSLTIPGNKSFCIAGSVAGTLVAEDNSTIILCGNDDQTISDATTFYNVQFAQGTEGKKINVPNTITINGAATFTSGIVNGNVAFGEGGSSAGANLNSYVDGTVTKTGNGSSFTFPTGSDGVLGTITATIGSGSWVSAKYNHNSADNGDGTHGFTTDVIPRWWNAADMCDDADERFDHVSNFEYWDVSSPVELSEVTLVSEAASATEHFNSTSAYVNNDIQVAAYTNGCWKNFEGSAVISGADHNIITITGATIPKDPHRAAADFLITLGSKSKNTVLPIELLSFTATCDGRSALVEWTTATERNNDYFSLERSEDAINFTEIARVAGAGNSIEPLDYSYTDYGIHGGDNYYRLVQFDYDGTRTVSDIVVANCIEEQASDPDVLAYPNPFNGELTLVLDNFSNRAAIIEVYDMLGKLIYTEKASAPQNSYETILNLSNLPSGAYTVRVSTTDFVINRNVVKQ